MEEANYYKREGKGLATKEKPIKDCDRREAVGGQV